MKKHPTFRSSYRRFAKPLALVAAGLFALAILCMIFDLKWLATPSFFLFFAFLFFAVIYSWMRIRKLLICPECGGKLQLADREKSICMSCGKKFDLGVDLTT
jgi:hypothetical protein